MSIPTQFSERIVAMQSIIPTSLACLIGTVLITSLPAAETPDEIRAGLAAHDRAIHLLDGWVRDPYIILGPDGFYCCTGATQIAPLKPDFSDYAGEPTRIGPAGATAKMGHEECFIRKIEGRYLLFGTGRSTGKMRKGSGDVVIRAQDPRYATPGPDEAQDLAR